MTNTSRCAWRWMAKNSLRSGFRPAASALAMGSEGAGHGGAPLAGCGAGDAERSWDEPFPPPHAEASAAAINPSTHVDVSPHVDVSRPMWSECTYPAVKPTLERFTSMVVCSIDNEPEGSTPISDRLTALPSGHVLRLLERINRDGHAAPACDSLEEH